MAIAKIKDEISANERLNSQLEDEKRQIADSVTELSKETQQAIDEIQALKSEQTNLGEKEQLIKRIVECLVSDKPEPELSAYDNEIRRNPALNLGLLKTLQTYIDGFPNYPKHERSTEDFVGQARKIIRYLDQKGEVLPALVEEFKSEITTH